MEESSIGVLVLTCIFFVLLFKSIKCRLEHVAQRFDCICTTLHVCSRLNMYAMKNESRWSPVYATYNVLICFRLKRRLCSRSGVIKNGGRRRNRNAAEIQTNDESSSGFHSQNMRYGSQMRWWETWHRQITSMKIIKWRMWRLSCVEFSRFVIPISTWCVCERKKNSRENKAIHESNDSVAFIRAKCICKSSSGLVLAFDAASAAEDEQTNKRRNEIKSNKWISCTANETNVRSDCSGISCVMREYV